MSSKHLDEIIELITKEEHLENEEKIEKAIAKSMEEQQQKLVVDSADQSVEELSKTTPEDEKHILTAPEELDIIAQEVKGNKVRLDQFLLNKHQLFHRLIPNIHDHISEDR